MLPWDEVAWPLLGAMLAGGLIGLEREWRGRPAGFRTHILVSLSSCLLMLAAIHQMHWAFDDIPADNIMTDPTRMAHGVLTGIGFLCAGVIFRHGFSIHGLTTAASLWMTSALGLLFGAGLIGLAAVGTVVTVTILVGLKLVSSRLPTSHAADIEVEWGRKDAPTGETVERVLAEHAPRAVAGRYACEGERIWRCWRVRVPNRAALSRLSDQLAQLEGVRRHDIKAHDD